MSLMRITLELGRTPSHPGGDPAHGYEFIAPLDAHDHLDAAQWQSEKRKCGVRSFRPGQPDRHGMLRHVGQGWRFDYDPGREADDEPFFKLDRHVIAPGFYLTITEDDGVARPFRIVDVEPLKVSA